MPDTLAQAKEFLNNTTRDPITQTLLQHSTLTRTQFETVLISLLGQELSGKPLPSNEKTALRPTRPSLTRGSFNRTLAQARRNIVKSIYTLILLGYVGLLDSPELTPFLELASRIRTYIDQRKSSVEPTTREQSQVVGLIAEELEKAIQALAQGRRENGVISHNHT